jgi:hypothetical protein
MRTIPFAGLCLISAMIALAQSPGRPSLLVQWPADVTFAPDPPPGNPSPAQAGTDIAASVAAEAVALLDLDPPAASDTSGGTAVRLPHRAAPAAEDARVELVEMRSLPSAAAAAHVPRRPTWAAVARPAPCPFHSAKACAMWQNGR